MRYDRKVRRFPVGLVFALALVACDGELRFAPDQDADPGDASSADTSSTCGVDDDCPFTTLHCDPASATCVACVIDAHCTSVARPRCDTATHQCVQCESNADCDAVSSCDSATHRCFRRCAVDPDDCTLEQPVCDASRDACVCSATSCTTDDRPHCDASSGLCVRCLGDGDCPSYAPHCQGGYCLKCLSDAECVAPRRCDPVRHQCF